MTEHDLELAEMIATNAGDIPDTIRNLVDELRSQRTELDGRNPDAGIKLLEEFNAAFDRPTQTAPAIPDVGESGRARLSWWASQLATMAAALKVEAAEVNGSGASALGELLIRVQLTVEETSEWTEAMASGDVVKALDGLLDMSYVNDGHYLSLGLADLKLAGYRIVHSCNMSKLGPDGKPMTTQAGRVIKGPNTRRPEPELAALIEGAGGRP